MSVFLKDIDKHREVSWEALIEDMNSASSYNPYCKSEDYYTVFKSIIVSLLIGEEIILLDSDFTDTELIKLTGFSDFKAFNTSIDKDKLLTLITKENLLEKLSNPSDSWRITLYTSGTTGLPKKVSHSFKSISRFAKVAKRNKKNIWGFAYNPTHMAGIQVFFQGLLNGNTFIRLFGLSTETIYDEILINEITHISATPTFYRLLLPCDIVFTSVERITSGGEKFNEKTFNQLSQLFPNAKLTNVYASTEAGTLFASENDIFSVKADYEDLVRIEENELIIHNTLMGDTGSAKEDWYNTGDVVEVISQQPLKFRFLNRKSEMINVGGYKVNPHEVEEAVLAFENIKNVRVYSKTNSILGNIICCEVVADSKEVTENAIRSFLQSKLQEFKIPRIIRFVDEITTTRTGKLKRG